MAIAVMLAMPGGASAGQPQPVTITVLTQFDSFGVICAAGTVSTVPDRFVGWQSGSLARILQVKSFVCPDGSFDVLLRVTLDFATGDTVGTWSVLSGSGAYASLHGAGSITGDKADPEATEILDIYTGGMHID
jgi:hypothetical protein